MKLDIPGALWAAEIPFVLTNGNGGRTKFWFSAQNERKQFETQLRAWGLSRTPPDRMVRLSVHRILGHGQRLWDPGSWQRGNWKEIQDSLVSVGWFRDDSCRWIHESIDFQQVDAKPRPKQSSTRIIVWPVDGSVCHCCGQALLKGRE